MREDSMLARIHDAEHSQHVAELSQKISQLEMKVDSWQLLFRRIFLPSFFLLIYQFV
jgi:hypothetical protein